MKSWCVQRPKTKMISQGGEHLIWYWPRTERSKQGSKKDRAQKALKKKKPEERKKKQESTSQTKRAASQEVTAQHCQGATSAANQMMFLFQTNCSEAVMWLLNTNAVSLVLRYCTHTRVLKGSAVKHFFFVLLLLQCCLFGEARKRCRSDLSWVLGNRNPRAERFLHGPASAPTEPAVQRLVGQVHPAGQDGLSKPPRQIAGGLNIEWLS